MYLSDEAIANKIRILALYKNLTLGETFNFLYRCWETWDDEEYRAMTHWWAHTAREFRGS